MKQKEDGNKRKIKSVERERFIVRDGFIKSFYI